MIQTFMVSRSNTSGKGQTMNREEYKDYEDRVERFFKFEGINNLSSIDPGQDAYFSTRPCDCCQRHWHGDREDANGYNPTTKQVQEYSVCIDCLYYAEYGQLDDMTMLDLEEEGQSL